MLVDHPFWPRGLISDASAGGLLFDLRPDKAPILADVSSIFISNITMYCIVLLALTPRSRLLSEFNLLAGAFSKWTAPPMVHISMQLTCSIGDLCPTTNHHSRRTFIVPRTLWNTGNSVIRVTLAHGTGYPTFCLVTASLFCHNSVTPTHH